MQSYEDKLATLLCEYSLKLKENDMVVIRGEACAEPLIKACYRKVLEMGAYPMVRMSFTEQNSVFYRYADDRQLTMIPPADIVQAETVNALIAIDSMANSRQLTNLDPSKIAKHQKTNAVLKEKMFEREAKGDFKWVIAPYPTSSMAQDAEMSLDEYRDFVFSACKLNESDPVAAWNRVKEYQDTIADRLQGAKKLRIVGKNTDLTLSVDGRKWINCSGRHNMPDGEVFTSPVETSAEGVVYFDIPTTYAGNEAGGITLELKEGKVVRATAEKGEAFLLSVLDMDEGSRILGEFAFGLNSNITTASKNILFDEKIGKTIHIAVGSSYPEAGGKNKSGLHWDLIKDMREGQVYVDDVLFYENGEFKL